MNDTKWNKIKLNKNSLFKLPHKSGIYLFCREYKIFGLKIKNNVEYVGQSKTSLRTRLSQHLLSPANEVLGRLNFNELICYYRVFPEDTVNSVERLMVEKLDPPANLIKPPSNDSLDPTDLELIN
ncbi:MAG: GIY-YIG nuclease family protein [Pseudomonadota bacterium]|nr:GIY-YIG nuclease family protein [Pseudomonadota bacterium]